jgi:hypothetical protein
MPLTPAHAAAAPLLHRLIRPLGLSIPISALVIGTMTPDFEYLIRLTPGIRAWHTPLGLLEFCLPVGLATWWVFRVIIGPALLRLLPPGLGAAARAQIAPGSTFRLIPGASVAVLLGAVSHDLWDSFTHEAGWGVHEIPALDASVPLGGTGATPWYSILQYGSSAIGLIVIIAILWQWVAAHPKADRHVPVGQRAWRIRELGVLLLVGVAGAVLNASRGRHSGLSWTLGLAAVGGMSALALALLAYGIIDSIRHRDAPARRDG